jgi:hypothetical protein
MGRIIVLVLWTMRRNRELGFDKKLIHGIDDERSQDEFEHKA